MKRARAPGATWDERRNTSRVFPVPEEALEKSLSAFVRSRGEDWYRWIVNRRDGVHDHDARRVDGKPAACPVPDCDARRDSQLQRRP